ncbi:MAG TPA: HD domain-containing phosphohydrolase, partial [Gaiellaceae bacterium]
TGRHGTQIPEGARLLAVADAFDAMVSMRPYRRAMPSSRALHEIERCSGSQFDPSFAAAFLEAWSAGALSNAAAI